MSTRSPTWKLSRGKLQSPEKPPSPPQCSARGLCRAQPVQLSMQQQMSQLHDCSHSCSQECWTYTYVQRVTRATVRDQHNLLVKKTATHPPTHTHTHSHTHTHTAWVRRKKNTQVHLVIGRRYSSKPTILQPRTQVEGANAQSRKEGSATCPAVLLQALRRVPSVWKERQGNQV